MIGSLFTERATMSGQEKDRFHRSYRTSCSKSRRFSEMSVFTSVLLPCLCLLVSVSSTHALEFLGQRNTYAKFPKWNACPDNSSISFEFKTQKANGLLMFTNDNNRYDNLQVRQLWQLCTSYVKFGIKIGSDWPQMGQIWGFLISF